MRYFRVIDNLPVATKFVLEIDQVRDVYMIMWQCCKFCAVFHQIALYEEFSLTLR